MTAEEIQKVEDLVNDKIMEVDSVETKLMTIEEAKESGATALFDEKYGDAREYAVTPGAVPIRVKSVGTVGIISVSGLSSEEDHGLIIKGLKYLLSRGDE